uniref:Family with sequence similarity 83 member Fb n=1 Tax=Gouania willdenowi TaxID=441366 RepID=A0A8C5D3L3_GOUWI
MSDTEVPPLDIGWPSGAKFKGVTRVAMHTHPPKENGPHIKQVVRKLIQEASKLIAIVMDLLTDVQILQDLMDAAWRRSVPVYILLDEQGVPHFLDMCSRLQIGVHHLRNIRCRVLQGVGFALSFGRLPGSVASKYMLVDGEKVVFGTYSFTWCTSRMDRNMITVMTGQLYAISEKLNLYKEFHISPPAARPIDTIRSRSESKRPPLPATTSRFQVTLGDSKKGKIEVPAHKFYNPKYALVFGDIIRPTGSLQEPGPTRMSALTHPLENEDPDKPLVTSSEKADKLSPQPAEAPSDIFKKPKDLKTDKKGRLTLKQKLFRRKSSSRPSISPLADPKPAEKDQEDSLEDTFECFWSHFVHLLWFNFTN